MTQPAFDTESPNPFTLFTAQQVASVMISEPVAVDLLTDDRSKDDRWGEDEPPDGYYTGLVRADSQLLLVTARKLILKLYETGKSAPVRKDWVGPAAGHWTSVLFKDMKGNILAEISLSPVSCFVVVHDGKTFRASGPAEQFVRIVFDLLKTRAPDLIRKWDKEMAYTGGLERSLFGKSHGGQGENGDKKSAQ